MNPSSELLTILLSKLCCSAPIQLLFSSLSTLPSGIASPCELSWSKSCKLKLGGNRAFNSLKNRIILCCLESPDGNNSKIFVSRNSFALSTSTVREVFSKGMN